MVFLLDCLDFFVQIYQINTYCVINMLEVIFFNKVVIFVEDDLQKVTLAICPLKGLYVLSAFREVSCQCFKEEIACHIPVYYDQPNGYTWETNTRPYPLKTFSILKMGIFHCYVSLPGGKSFI